MKKQIFPISAFIPPPDSTLTVDGKTIERADFRTSERYREYRDCGFNEIMFSGETKYCGEPFEHSALKKMLDLAESNNLLAIVFDERIVSITNKAKEHIVGEVFETADKLRDYVMECMRDYAKHAAFYGVCVTDEPMIAQAGVIREIADAVHAAHPSAFVHTCFLPFIQDRGRIEGAFGKGYRDGWAAYRNYIRKMSASIGYFGYDAYPFGMWEEKNDMCAGFVRNMQEVALTANRCGVPFHMTIQAFSSGKKEELRKVDESDLNWQSNLALSFGCKKIYYFTYWRFCSRSSEFFTSAVMDDFGEKLIYDEAQRNNALIQKIFPYLENATYAATKIFGGAGKNKAMRDMKVHAMPEIYACKSIAPAIVNKLKKKDGAVYCIMNMRDPYEKYINAVRFRTAWAKERLEIVKRGTRMQVFAENGVFRLALEPGEAVWILRENDTDGGAEKQ